MNDLKPFEHGEEGTHAVCSKHNIGGKSVCCECSGKTDCSNDVTTPPTPQETWEALKVKHNPRCTLLEGHLYFREDEVIRMIDDALSSSHTALVEKVKHYIANAETHNAPDCEQMFMGCTECAKSMTAKHILKLIQDSHE